MNIGIIKLWFSLPGKNSKLQQTTGWTQEVFDFCDTIKRNGHKPFIMSNVDGMCAYNEWDKEKLDIVFVFCSKNILSKDDSIEKFAKFNQHVNTYVDVCKILKTSGTKIVYVIVDLQLIDNRFIAIADRTISQGDLGQYLPIEQLPLTWKKYRNTKKQYRVIYLGNQRDENRTTKLLYYNNIYKGKLDIYGKWEDPRITALKNFKGPIDFKDSQKLLSKYMYSLMLTDKIYEKLNFVTPRYYEAFAAGTIPLCDDNYDCAGRLSNKISAAALPPKNFYNKVFKKLSNKIYHSYKFDKELNIFLDNMEAMK